MAEFCKQCSIDIFGKDFHDFVGITKPEAWAGNRAACVICEGCGPIQVDPEGNCVSSDCLEKGKPGHGLPWVQPIYRHRCSACVFIRTITVKGLKYDVYRCSSEGTDNAVWLARYNDDEGGYWSMPWKRLKDETDGKGTQLMQAMKRLAAEEEGEENERTFQEPCGQA